MEFCDYIEIETVGLAGTLCCCDRCHRYVLATTDGNDKMCVLGQIITRH